MFQPIIWWNEGFLGVFWHEESIHALFDLHTELGFVHEFGWFQPTQTRWLANMKYKHSKLWVLGLRFRCTRTPIVAHDFFERAQGATSINDLCLLIVRFKLGSMKTWKLLELRGWSLGLSNIWCKSEKRGGLSVTGGVHGLCLLSNFIFLIFSYEICEVFYCYLVHCLQWLFDKRERI